MALSPDNVDRLREIAAQTFAVDPSDIADDASPDTVEGWTSFNHLTLMSAVEGEFGLRFSMGEMSAVKDFPSLCALVERRLSA